MQRYFGPRVEKVSIGSLWVDAMPTLATWTHSSLGCVGEEAPGVGPAVARGTEGGTSSFRRLCGHRVAQRRRGKRWKPQPWRGRADVFFGERLAERMPLVCRFGSTRWMAQIPSGT